MAIVEDEVRNESEEDNEIEVVVDEDDGEQDSADEESDDEEETALERKVLELEDRISLDPYNYDDHIQLIQGLWSLSELERWRTAFENLYQITILKAEHWLLRIQTEVSLAHTPEARDNIIDLFHQATIDCYSIQILSEWCTWSMGAGDAVSIRSQLSDVVKRGGADPLSGKLFWDAKTEFEKGQLTILGEDDAGYRDQQERVLFCLEEKCFRPLMHNEDDWPELETLALKIRDQAYIEKLKKQHEAALEYLQQVTPYEDKLLTMENSQEKCKVFQEYIEAVKELSKGEKYRECDSEGILKVLYDRATTDCLAFEGSYELLCAFAAHARATQSRATYTRVLNACARRCPRKGKFWTLLIQQAEHEGQPFDNVKSILETALGKGLESFKECESVWLTYLEYMRRQTAFDSGEEVERLRRTFRLAWDSLAESWGADANDCEIPLFWARIEYKRLNDPKQGKEIFEEIFKYGENKSLSKYWEAFLQLESSKTPPPSESKLRDLHRRALRFVTDYPPAVVRLWTDRERDVGSLEAMRHCTDACEEKLKEWRDSYQNLLKMSGQKHKGDRKSKKPNKKSKFEKPKTQSEKDNQDKTQTKDKPHTTDKPLTAEKSPGRGKRKLDEQSGSGESKKKRDNMDVDANKGDESTEAGKSLKRSHDGESTEAADNKRKRTSSASSDGRQATRDDCTLFVSNLEFKVNEANLRDKLSEFGDIVSMRVRNGVKAFGGSICYCQYKSPGSVTKALEHDRTPLDGRPMFLSQYSDKKGGKMFKYSTHLEKNKLFVRNLPYAHCTKEALGEIFDKHGALRDVRVVTFKDGKPKGIAYIEYEDASSAQQAIEKTNGLLLGDRTLEVAISAPPPKAEGSALGLPKRDAGGGTRRNNLSKFIPSVLQKASTSTEPNGSHSNGQEKRPLSNSDFRSLLLKK